jgi:Ni2+-binding GTPase involved in maturation of urease and hydrogenase
MNDTRVYIVGGFLGSGKTTAIAAAARQLIEAGVRVGVVTNDQGRYLVDTLFFEMENVPAVEVSGGCFCCNYDDFEERLAALAESARPDVIFAESVGSCADVVATVVQPLDTMGLYGFRPAGLSVFTDSRLLRLYLEGQPLPFSPEVVYIFEKQLEEAGQIVINKADLLDTSALGAVLDAAQRRYPRAAVRAQNSREPGDIAQWLQGIESGEARAASILEEIDYDRYGAGEAELAWLDQEIWIRAKAGQSGAAVKDLLIRIEACIRGRGWAVGHLKFIVRDGDDQAKISATTVPVDDWLDGLPSLHGDTAGLLINARVATTADALKDCVQGCVEASAAKLEFAYGMESSECFHPGYPVPRYRMGL